MSGEQQPLSSETTSDSPESVQDAIVQELDPASELIALRAEFDAFRVQAESQRDQLLRAVAEAENARRRANDEVAKTRAFAIESFGEALVPVRDSLEAALAQTEQTADTMREGIEITLRQLTAAFEKHKLVEVAPQAGERFDPNRHQAIASVPDSGQPAQCVVTTLQKGYVLAERVLRPALVTVSAG